MTYIENSTDEQISELPLTLSFNMFCEQKNRELSNDADLSTFYNEIMKNFDNDIEYVQMELFTNISLNSHLFNASDILSFFDIIGDIQDFDKIQIISLINILINVVEYLKKNGIKHINVKENTTW